MSIFLAAALSRLVALTCPHCGNRKTVERREKPVAFRVCPRCHRRFTDIEAASAKKHARRR